MFKIFKITCDEATLICDKSQYNEATLLEKVKLNLHFLQCKICKLYTQQNTKMSRLFKVKSADCKKHKKCLSELDKKNLSVEFNKMRE